MTISPKLRLAQAIAASIHRAASAIAANDSALEEVISDDQRGKFADCLLAISNLPEEGDDSYDERRGIVLDALVEVEIGFTSSTSRNASDRNIKIVSAAIREIVAILDSMRPTLLRMLVRQFFTSPKPEHFKEGSWIRNVAFDEKSVYEQKVRKRLLDGQIDEVLAGAAADLGLAYQEPA